MSFCFSLLMGILFFNYPVYAQQAPWLGQGHDPDLSIRDLPTRAVHLTDLRQAINDRRAQCGPLSNHVWATDPIITAGQTVIRASHFTELLTAFDEIYMDQASRSRRSHIHYPIPAIVAANNIQAGAVISASTITDIRDLIINTPCCGDGICNGPETIATCPTDPCSPLCNGNQRCEPALGETIANCSDCLACLPFHSESWNVNDKCVCVNNNCLNINNPNPGNIGDTVTLPRPSDLCSGNITYTCGDHAGVASWMYGPVSHNCVYNGCGNHVYNGSPGFGYLDLEVCDETDPVNGLNGHTCQNLNQGFTGGTLHCNGTCNDFDTRDCTTCVNNVAEIGETCDGSDLKGATCTSLGFAGGTLECNLACNGYTGCTNCGNNNVESGESCDGNDLNGQTCATQGFTGHFFTNQGISNGNLQCDNSCAFNTSDCTNCLNNILDPGEICDTTHLNGQTCATQGFTSGILRCNSTCTFDTTSCASCSDQIKNQGETGIDCGGPNCAPCECLPDSYTGGTQTNLPNGFECQSPNQTWTFPAAKAGSTYDIACPGVPNGWCSGIMTMACVQGIDINGNPFWAFDSLVSNTCTYLHCGNGSCEIFGQENHVNCPADCP